MNKETFIVFSEWEDNCEDLTDEEFGRLMRAFFKYAKNGVKPTFSDRAMRACWRPIQQATDRANEAYQAKCEKNRENGKKGGAPKGNMNAQKQPNNPNNQTVEKTTENNRKQPKTTETTLPDRDRDRDPQRDRGREREREPEAASAAKSTPPAADTTTTTREAIEEDIIDAWHWQDCTTELRSVGGRRWDRTEMAMAVAGGKDAFLDLIRSLDSQAYFKTHRVDYDWFVDPKNFQNILEGKYKEPHKPARKEGWE